MDFFLVLIIVAAPILPFRRELLLDGSKRKRTTQAARVHMT